MIFKGEENTFVEVMISSIVPFICSVLFTAIQPAPETSTTTTATASTMPSRSSEPVGVSPPVTSVEASSPETSGGKSFLTAGKSPWHFKGLSWVCWWCTR